MPAGKRVKRSHPVAKDGTQRSLDGFIKLSPTILSSPVVATSATAAPAPSYHDIADFMQPFSSSGAAWIPADAKLITGEPGGTDTQSTDAGDDARMRPVDHLATAEGDAVVHSISSSDSSPSKSGGGTSTYSESPASTASCTVVGDSPDSMLVEPPSDALVAAPTPSFPYDALDSPHSVTGSPVTTCAPAPSPVGRPTILGPEFPEAAEADADSQVKVPVADTGRHSLQTNALITELTPEEQQVAAMNVTDTVEVVEVLMEQTIDEVSVDDAVETVAEGPPPILGPELPAAAEADVDVPVAATGCRRNTKSLIWPQALDSLLLDRFELKQAQTHQTLPYLPDPFRPSQDPKGSFLF